METRGKPIEEIVSMYRYDIASDHTMREERGKSSNNRGGQK